MPVYPQSITDQATIYESAGYPQYPGGGYHGGIDTVHNNHMAYAPASGTVVVAHVWQGTTADEDSWGNYIVVDMGNGSYWLAAHFTDQLHAVGEVITRGDYIGQQGMTGNVTGIHTHWEYWVGGQSTAYRQDPSPLLGIPNGAPATYDVSWDAGEPPGPGPDPGPGPGPGHKIPIWMLFRFNKGVFFFWSCLFRHRNLTKFQVLYTRAGLLLAIPRWPIFSANTFSKRPLRSLSRRSWISGRKTCICI